MKRRNRLSIDQISAALSVAGGEIPIAARELGVSRQAVAQRVARSARLRAEIEDFNALFLSMSHHVVKKEIVAGGLRTALWYLERKGKHLGFSLRQELTGKDGESLNPTALEALSDAELELLAGIRARVKDRPPSPS